MPTCLLLTPPTASEAWAAPSLPHLALSMVGMQAAQALGDKMPQ